MRLSGSGVRFITCIDFARPLAFEPLVHQLGLGAQSRVAPSTDVQATCVASVPPCFQEMIRSVPNGSMRNSR